VQTRWSFSSSAVGSGVLEQKGRKGVIQAGSLLPGLWALTILITRATLISCTRVRGLWTVSRRVAPYSSEHQLPGLSMHGLDIQSLKSMTAHPPGLLSWGSELGMGFGLAKKQKGRHLASGYMLLVTDEVLGLRQAALPTPQLYPGSVKGRHCDLHLGLRTLMALSGKAHTRCHSHTEVRASVAFCTQNRLLGWLGATRDTPAALRSLSLGIASHKKQPLSNAQASFTDSSTPPRPGLLDYKD
jgi:hypothetical protein